MYCITMYSSYCIAPSCRKLSAGREAGVSCSGAGCHPQHPQCSSCWQDPHPQQQQQQGQAAGAVRFIPVSCHCISYPVKKIKSSQYFVSANPTQCAASCRALHYGIGAQRWICGQLHFLLHTVKEAATGCRSPGNGCGVLAAADECIWHKWCRVSTNH